MESELLKQNLLKSLTISNADLETICTSFKKKHLKKGDFLLEQGRICKLEGFVINGCFRVYTVDAKGKENTLYFAVKDWWLMDNDSFANQIPSELNIQALEESTILYVDKQDKEQLYQQVPMVEKLFRIMFQKAVGAWQKRLIRNHCLSAKERYQYFLKTYPNIVCKLTDRQISSYLGITHEFLSKIKKQS